MNKTRPFFEKLRFGMNVDPIILCVPRDMRDPQTMTIEAKGEDEAANRQSTPWMEIKIEITQTERPFGVGNA